MVYEVIVNRVREGWPIMSEVFATYDGARKSFEQWIGFARAKSKVDLIVQYFDECQEAYAETKNGCQYYLNRKVVNL